MSNEWQGVGPYDFKVTDESDLCEGASGAAATLSDIVSPIDDTQRFHRVRSGVKEGAGWGIVMLCSNIAGLVEPADLERVAESLVQIILHDNNVIVVGFALDALVRIAVGLGPTSTARASAEKLVNESRGWRNQESLCRAMWEVDEWRARLASTDVISSQLI